MEESKKQGPGPGIEPGSGDPQSPRMSITPPRPFEPMENENMLKNINFPLDFVGENSAWIDELTG